jgi:hypothetical protein
MNDSPVTRSPGLWTFGHRRYYSPMLHASGGQPPGDATVKLRVRPVLDLRGVSGPATVADRAPPHACEAP